MSKTIKFEKLDTEEVWNEYFELTSTFQEELGISYDKAAIAVSIALGVCKYCWKSSNGCNCIRDE